MRTQISASSSRFRARCLSALRQVVQITRPVCELVRRSGWGLPWHCIEIKELSHIHLRGVPGDLDILNETEPRRIKNFYYLYRNTAYLRRTYWPRHGFYLFLGKAMLQFVQALTGREPRLRRAWTILAGISAGLFFRPRQEQLGVDGSSPLAQPIAKVAVRSDFASSH